MTSQTTYVRACALADVPEDGVLGVALGDVPVAIIRDGGEVWVELPWHAQGHRFLGDTLASQGQIEAGYHEAVLRTGAYVGYDQVGKPKYATDERRAEALAILAARGHGAKLLISGDLGRKSYWGAYGGRPGLDYIPKTFLSMLCAAGLSTGQAEALVVANPARAFG